MPSNAGSAKAAPNDASCPPPAAMIAFLDRLSSDLGRCDVGVLDNDGLRVVASAARRVERTTAALLVRLGQRADALAAEGRAAPAEETLGRSGDVSAARAREEAARARTASRIPALGEALEAGAISAEHVDAVARALKGLNKDQQDAFLDNEEDLADSAERLPVDTYNEHIRRRARQVKGDDGLKTLQQQREASELKLWKTNDGMGHLKGSLDPERFAAFENAIQQQTRSLAKQPRLAGQDSAAMGPNLQATALVELVSHGNGRAGRSHISLVIDEQTAATGPHHASLCETDTGTALPVETVSRLACDAVIRTVRLDHRGVPISVGRKYRTATDAQWAALKAIHDTCAWDNCDRPITWCQAHHINEWDNGGSTDLDNLIPLCNTHHHAVHEGQWRIKLEPDRTLEIRQRNGKHWANATPNRRRKRENNP